MIRRNGKQNRELVYGVNAQEAALETATEKIVSALWRQHLKKSSALL